jgi:hypothetical protein
MIPEHAAIGLVQPRDNDQLVPTSSPKNASANRGSISSHASGAPSDPCRGASARPFPVDRMKPTGCKVYPFIG